MLFIFKHILLQKNLFLHKHLKSNCFLWNIIILCFPIKIYILPIIGLTVVRASLLSHLWSSVCCSKHGSFRKRGKRGEQHDRQYAGQRDGQCSRRPVLGHVYHASGNRLASFYCSRADWHGYTLYMARWVCANYRGVRMR